MRHSHIIQHRSGIHSNAKYRLKIMAVLEIRWQETGSLEINNHTIFHRKHDNRQFNTVFIVHKSLIPAIIEFK